MANDKTDDTESKKIATFLWLVGSNGSNIYNTLYPNDGSSDALLGITRNTVNVRDANGEHVEEREVLTMRKLDEVLKKFDAHCLPQKNMILQKEKQSFNEFETELRTQLRRCEFNCTCVIVS